jgi:magnesium chelatase family protein
VESLSGILAVGELALGGELRPVRGALSLAILARSAGLTLVVPKVNAVAAALVPGVSVVGANDLGEVVAWLRGDGVLGVEPPNTNVAAPSGVDLADVKGHAVAKQALEIAAAGAHHLVLIGPPGAGNRCWPDACPRCFRPCRSPRRSRPRGSTAPQVSSTATPRSCRSGRSARRTTR